MGTNNNEQPATLWAALLLPDLALEQHVSHAQQITDTSNSGSASPVTNPFAIVHREGSKRLLTACNSAARAAGLKAGLTLNAAYAICPSLDISEYDEATQQQHIEALCLWATRYSSWVAPVMPDTVMLEIGASLSLCGGLENLTRQLLDDLSNQAITATIGVSATPEAAQLLSRLHHVSGKQPAPLINKTDLESALQDVPVSALPFNAFTRKGLQQSGIKRCGQLFKLPATALTRRFGVESTELIYKLLGRIPDPYPAFEVPESFCRDIDLPLEAPDTTTLQFPMNRLLHALGGYLRSIDAGVRKLDILLFHEKLKATQTTLGFLQATSDHRHLQRVATEKLSALVLAAPVTALRLIATETAPVSHSARDLLNHSNHQRNTIEQAMDLLGARIGRDKVYRAQLGDDHRPERAWSQSNQPGTSNSPHTARPLWLLPEPRFAESPLCIKSRPERIEYGWWDAEDVRRDYYIAEDCDGRWLWVFNERRGRLSNNNNENCFFIHGLFA